MEEPKDPISDSHASGGLWPRERAELFGIDSLSTAELLALILRVGSQGCTVVQLTESLMAANEGSLRKLGQRKFAEISATPGVGKVKAQQIQAIMTLAKRYHEEQYLNKRKNITCSKDIYELMWGMFASKDKEEIWILTLSRRHDVIGRHHITTGSSVSSVFDLKAALKLAILDDASAMVMCHNHPSGNLKPSPQDDMITRNLVEGGRQIDVKVLDHLIITSEGYYSYNDQGRL